MFIRLRYLGIVEGTFEHALIVNARVLIAGLKKSAVHCVRIKFRIRQRTNSGICWNREQVVHLLDLLSVHGSKGIDVTPVQAINYNSNESESN